MRMGAVTGAYEANVQYHSVRSLDAEYDFERSILGSRTQRVTVQ